MLADWLPSIQVLMQWTDLPNPSWVEAAHMVQECQRAYGSAERHTALLQKMEKFKLD